MAPALVDADNVAAADGDDDDDDDALVGEVAPVCAIVECIRLVLAANVAAAPIILGMCDFLGWA